MGRVRGPALHRHPRRRAEAEAQHQVDAHDDAAARQQGQVLRAEPLRHSRPRQLRRRGGGGGARDRRDAAGGGRRGRPHAQHRPPHPPGVPGAAARRARHQQGRPAHPGAQAAARRRLLQAQARGRGGQHGARDSLGPGRRRPPPAAGQRRLRLLALRLHLHPRLLRRHLRRHTRRLPRQGAREAAVGRLLVRRDVPQVQEEPDRAGVSAHLRPLRPRAPLQDGVPGRRGGDGGADDDAGAAGHLAQEEGDPQGRALAPQVGSERLLRGAVGADGLDRTPPAVGLEGRPEQGGAGVHGPARLGSGRLHAPLRNRRPRHGPHGQALPQARLRPLRRLRPHHVGHPPSRRHGAGAGGGVHGG
mmetsp:Transcript_51916/g.135485  ORF Transcript_51916/g.135485 Transcript_51916/m.135485 type:complete len:360 (+) Transcript_51916:1470-2549(+)